MLEYLYPSPGKNSSGIPAKIFICPDSGTLSSLGMEEAGGISENPAVWQRIARRVTFSSGTAAPERKRRPLSSGTYFETGSSRDALPSSTSAIRAAAVTDFVWEAIQNTVSRSIGLRDSKSANPAAAKQNIFPSRAASATAPGIEPSAARDSSASAAGFAGLSRQPKHRIAQKTHSKTGKFFIV